MANVPVKCIHCRSENVVKMGKQPTTKTPRYKCNTCKKPSKPYTKTPAPHPKPNK